MKERTKEYFDRFFDSNKELKPLEKKLIEALNVLKTTVCSGKKILVCGNGGSAADAEHLSGELLKSFVLKRKVPDNLKNKLISDYGEEGEWIANNLQMGIKCIPLTSFCAYNTAFLNDCNEKLLFGQLVNALGEKGDTLLAFSTSGNSQNVVLAAKIAASLGINVISLTGNGGGKLKDISNVWLNVPSDQTYRIQEFHLPVYHLICLALESECFDL